MAVTVYRSTDGSAPTLSGTVGSLVALLDAILVNGYGAKAAAGWSKPFTATNQATFRPGSGVQHYFHIDDNAPNVTAGSGVLEAYVRGSETATAYNTGTGFFPSTALNAGVAPLMRKSATANATARQWLVIADDRTVHLFVQTGDTAGRWLGGMWGEFYSIKSPAWAYRSCIFGSTVADTLGTSARSSMVNTSGAENSSGSYIPRSSAGVYTNGQTCGQHGDTPKSQITGSSSLMGSAGPTAVDPVTGGLWVAPLHIQSSTPYSVHGRQRGTFHVCANASFLNDADTFTPSSGVFAGRTFLIIKTAGLCCIDTTGPWETN